jgi:hypothetical protein
MSSLPNHVQDENDRTASGIIRRPSGCSLGIMVSAKLASSSEAAARSERILKEKSAEAKKYGIDMFVFYPGGVCWEKHTIEGYKYTSDPIKNSQWVKKSFPFPDVIYNRIHSRRLESKPKVKRLLRKFENNTQIKLFNSRYLDKWEVYRTLQNDIAASVMVPLTRLLTYSNLATILSNSREVFIKPRNNNAARGIVKIIKKSPDTYIYSKAGSTEPVWAKCCSLNSLWHKLKTMVVTPNEYLVQAGIDLCRINGRVVDFRAQIQKNGLGHWVFTGMEARVAQKSNFVTTGINYGKIISGDKAIKAIFDGSVNHRQMLDLQLQYLISRVPACLEKNLDIALAVLSIDIGLDKNGKLWIIEVSSKPEPFVNRDIRKIHYKHLMEYILYISRP